MDKRPIKVLVLLSGGLDSILAVKLLLEQGIEVEAINFRTNFCGPSKARPAAKILGVPLREVDIRQDFLAVLKKPKHGYGAGLNPCIDCHALMLKKAGEIMRAEGACPEPGRRIDFIATGEVLGERPMSQHKRALKIVEKEAGLEGYLLRPLSAKLLEPTIPEIDGRVDREKLLDISGRSRKRQMELAVRYGIKNYPTPAGGCALTEKGFAQRLGELINNKPDFDATDVDLIKIGRHFFIKNAQIILGRNQQENEILKSARKENDVFIIPINFSGPEALISGKGASEFIDKTKELIIRFSPKAKNLNKNQLDFTLVRR
jgi:tRNA U34 2-thiouridine synthase MnmA/TrmU